MSEDKKSKQDYDKDYQDNFKIFAVIVGIMCLGAYKYEHQIKLWFYNNLVMLVLGGFGLLALLVMYVISRMKKNDREFIARAKSLEQLKPKTRNPQTYYQRRP